MSILLAKPYNQYQSYKAGEYITFEGNNYYIALKDSAKQQSPRTASNNWQQVFNSSGLTPSGVTAGTYGDATHVGQFTVDVNGIITNAVDVLITAGGTGTVTSVAMSVPTGLTVTGSPITTAGTLAVTLTAGYVIPTTTEETNWNTAYTNRITSLTTTGTSGAATLIANTLNIPQYSGATVAGADKQVQYNDSGAFGAEAGFEYDKTTNELTVPDLIDSGLTASEIVASNGSKKLVSLAVATYPSLTELSYLKGVTSAVQTQLGLLAPLASPVFTGNPTAPTPTAGDNDTSIATTAFVTTAVAAVSPTGSNLYLFYNLS